jgi:hypothetical protein
VRHNLQPVHDMPAITPDLSAASSCFWADPAECSLLPVLIHSPSPCVCTAILRCTQFCLEPGVQADCSHCLVCLQLRDCSVLEYPVTSALQCGTLLLAPSLFQCHWQSPGVHATLLCVVCCSLRLLYELHSSMPSHAFTCPHPMLRLVCPRTFPFDRSVPPIPTTLLVSLGGLEPGWGLHHRG